MGLDPGAAGESIHGPDRALRVRLQNYTLFVRDQDRSLRFYVEQLGFHVVGDTTLSSGARWVGVAPPDGTALIALVAPAPGSEEYARIGAFTQVVFLAEDVAATFEEWSRRGVRFHQPPAQPEWGGAYTTFEDVDGNSFVLVGFDDVSRKLESERQAATERLEEEQRGKQELEIARQVQSRLFPQSLPPLETLDYAGLCIQARQVGGDYYDFLPLGGRRVGLVIADISGKGIGAALLMAHLQANLRSQCAVASDRPERFLGSVNRLFREASPDSSYATLVYVEYDDASRRLRYASCGHPPAVILRRDGGVEHLSSTATAVGLFEDWECTVGERQMAPGDTLALYTDGVTEAFGQGGEEFGEERLVASLRHLQASSAQAIVSQLADAVARFSPAEGRDDITLIVAKVRETPAT
jgi:phosphoserine phosphatase RsbU/P